MAITIIKSPNKFTPAENPIIFQVESDNLNLIYFRIEVLEAVTDSVISFLDCYTTPNYSNGTHVNISRILSNFTKWQIKNNISTAFFACPNETVKYKLKITERGYVSGLMSDLGTFTTTEDLYAWYASFDKFSFNLEGYKDYILNDISINKFLTHKPNTVYVNEYSFEQLYFLNDSAAALLTVKIDIYNPDGSFLQNISYNITPAEKIYALNVSPKAIHEYFAISIASIGAYTVEVFNGDVKISETRRYIFKKNECHLEPVNLVWINPLGGVDSYQFVQPHASLTVARGSIKKNSFKINDGIYSDMTVDAYNVTDEIYSSTSTVEIKLWTKVLTDKEVEWLGEMVASKQVWVELTDNTLVPVNLITTNFNYQRQRYLQNNVNVMQFEFNFGENVTPVLSNASYIQTTIYYNVERSRAIQKNDCEAAVGSFELFVVEAGKYSSLISQADADAQADNEIDTMGQAYANIMGSCNSEGVFGNEILTASKRKICETGYYGSLETYYVFPNTYYAFSQLAANNLAQADINANAQTHANTVGTCTIGYGNVEMSNDVQKNDCTPPLIGSVVTFTVPAYSYFGSTQAEANGLASDYMGYNQQTYANTNGTCIEAPYSISLTARFAYTTAGGVDKVYGWVEASQPILDNLIIQMVGVDTTDASEYPLPTVGMYPTQTNSSVVPIADVAAGYGVNIIAQILSVNTIVPTNTTYIYF